MSKLLPQNKPSFKVQLPFIYYNYLRWLGIILIIGNLHLLPAYASPELLKACNVPANKQATPQTVAVLDYFCDLKNQPDNRVVSGQHISHSGWDAVDNYQDFVEGLHDETGHYVGLIGTGMTHSKLEKVVTILTDYWRAGGLVEVDVHFDNPWTSQDSWVDDTHEPKPNLLELIPGEADFDPEVYANWQTQIDHTATGLQALQEAGVVVLWRPLHEMNGSWFWWGVDRNEPDNAEAYQKLWQELFTYYTETKGLNNLIWVYSPIISWNQDVLTFYPGDDYVDMVGLDYYDDDLPLYHSDYEDLRSLGKPMGFTEVGPEQKDGTWDTRTIIQSIRKHHPEFVFFMEWSSWDNGQVALIDNRYAEDLLADPWVITRDEVRLSKRNFASRHKMYVPLFIP